MYGQYHRFLSCTFDMFDVASKQRHRTAMNLFLNGTKNSDVDGTCKRSLTILYTTSLSKNTNTNALMYVVFSLNSKQSNNISANEKTLFRTHGGITLPKDHALISRLDMVTDID